MCGGQRSRIFQAGHYQSEGNTIDEKCKQSRSKTNAAKLSALLKRLAAKVKSLYIHVFDLIKRTPFHLNWNCLPNF